MCASIIMRFAGFVKEKKIRMCEMRWKTAAVNQVEALYAFIPSETEDGRHGTATRRHRRVVLFRFAWTGRGNFIDFERNSGALFFPSCHRGFRSAARKYAGFPDQPRSRRLGEIKIDKGCLLFRASTTRAIVRSSIFFAAFQLSGKNPSTVLQPVQAQTNAAKIVKTRA